MISIPDIPDIKCLSLAENLFRLLELKDDKVNVYNGIELVINRALPDNMVALVSKCPKNHHGCGKFNCIGGRHIQIIKVCNA